MKTPDTRHHFKIAPYYAYKDHTPRYKRSLPWDASHIERDGSRLYLASGDRNYEASLFMLDGRLCAVVNRVYASRKDRLAFYGHDHADYLEHLKRTVLHERITALFREYPRERIAEVIHAALGLHNAFCNQHVCPYPESVSRITGRRRWTLDTEPEDKYTFGR